MNIININEENNSNGENKVKEIDINKLEIDLLETINENDLFKNIENNVKIKNNFMDKKNNLIPQHQSITDNYQLNVDAIVDKKTIIIKLSLQLFYFFKL